MCFLYKLDEFNLCNQLKIVNRKQDRLTETLYWKFKPWFTILNRPGNPLVEKKLLYLLSRDLINKNKLNIFKRLNTNVTLLHGLYTAATFKYVNSLLLRPKHNTTHRSTVY